MRLTGADGDEGPAARTLVLDLKRVIEFCLLLTRYQLLGRVLRLDVLGAQCRVLALCSDSFLF